MMMPIRRRQRTAAQPAEEADEDAVNADDPSGIWDPAEQYGQPTGEEWVLRANRPHAEVRVTSRRALEGRACLLRLQRC